MLGWIARKFKAGLKKTRSAFAGVVGVLWSGARDVRTGTMTPGELVQFLFYAVMVAGAVGALHVH